MPKIEWWPFMARTMVEDRYRVKSSAIKSLAARAAIPPAVDKAPAARMVALSARANRGSQSALPG
jgi:hypothetical protein